MRLQALDLSTAQARSFKKAYSAGEVDTEVMLNFFNYMPHPPGSGLQLLTVPRLDPVHFGFMGNRPYQNQVVSNGECCAVLSHERISKSQQDKPAINVVRMEVITRAHLPFLKVAEPTERQLRQVYADFVQWTVSRFSSIKDTWPPEAVDFALSMSADMRPETGSERARMLAGEDPREVLAEWIAQGTPDASIVRAVPAFRRNRP